MSRYEKVQLVKKVNIPIFSTGDIPSLVSNQQTIVRTGRVGRPRILPYEWDTPSQVREGLGKKIKDFTPEQRRAYNRVAKRTDYAKLKTIETAGDTASAYKRKLGKSIKQMTATEKKKYNELAKKQSRIKKNLIQYK